MFDPLTFTRARIGWRPGVLSIAAVPDEAELYEPSTLFYWYVHPDPPGDQWGSYVADVRVHAISSVKWADGGRRFCLMSAEGDVIFIDDPIARERIVGSGISAPDSEYYGRMNSMREVGGQLFACGDGGQIYMREHVGLWRCLDRSLLQPLQVPAAERDMFHRIDGPSASEVYVVGRFGKILYWDGAAVRRLASPTSVMLNDILVEDRDRIWICGREGTLLRGNARDGFAPAPGSGGPQTFATMTRFDDKLYLASSARPRGLFTYRGTGFDRVLSGLAPDITDVHTVDSGYGALWTVGSKDILRYDGKTWERIDFPGNPPVRP